MKVFLVWYKNEELGNEAALWGLYLTKEGAEKALAESGFNGWINEETAQ